MNEQEREFITTARALLSDPNADLEYTLAHYYQAHEANPDNAEAEFFAAYLGFKGLSKKGDGASAANAFKAMTNCLEKAIRCVKNSEGDETEKYTVLASMVKAYTPITRYLFAKHLSTTADTIEGGVLGLYALGTTIKNEFGTDAIFMQLVVEPWKEAVSLQRTYYAYKYKGVKPEDYVTEIQKFDPSYTIPNKAGCVTIGK